MLRPLQLLPAIVFTLTWLPGVGRAEVPDWPVERLESMADSIVVGVVRDQHVSTTPRSRNYITTIHVVEAEKGDAEPGDEVRVSWFRRDQMPMTTGTSGHRGTLPEIGATIRVYIDDRGGAILPNGFGEVNGLFVTPAVLESDDQTALESAAEDAMRVGAFREAKLAYTRLMELDGDDVAPEDESRLRVLLSRAMFGMGEYLESADTLEPVLLKLEPSSREAAFRYFAAVWHTGDDDLYNERFQRLARQHPERWSDEYRNYREMYRR